jgi:hypothetical protein
MTNMMIMKSLRSKIHKKTLIHLCIYCMGMDRLIFTFQGKQNLLKQLCVSMALSSSMSAV